MTVSILKPSQMEKGKSNTDVQSKACYFRKIGSR